MKSHLLLSLTLAGILLSAAPVLAGDHRPAITITARIGDLFPRPPAVVIVREPVRRERVIVVEHRSPSRHNYRQHGRRHECRNERQGWSGRDEREERNRHGYRDRERVVVVQRGRNY